MTRTPFPARRDASKNEAKGTGKKKHSSSLPRVQRKRRILNVIRIASQTASKKSLSLPVGPQEPTFADSSWVPNGVNSRLEPTGSASSPDPLPPPFALPKFYEENREKMWLLAGGDIEDSERPWRGDGGVGTRRRGARGSDEADVNCAKDVIDGSPLYAWTSMVVPAFKNLPVCDRPAGLKGRAPPLIPRAEAAKTRSSIVDRWNVGLAKNNIVEDIVDMSSPELSGGVYREDEGRAVESMNNDTLNVDPKALVRFTTTNVLDTTSGCTATSVGVIPEEAPKPPSAENFTNIALALHTTISVPNATETDLKTDDDDIPRASSQPFSFDTQFRSLPIITASVIVGAGAAGSLDEGSGDGDSRTLVVDKVVVRNPLLRRMLRA